MTARSASMLRGGCRSSSSPTLFPFALRGGFSTVATGSIRLLKRNWREGGWEKGRLRRQRSAAESALLPLSLSSPLFPRCIRRHCRHHPDFQLAVDFARVANLHGVEAEFLERAFEANLIGRQMDVARFERGHDFRRADAAVEVTIFRGI